MRILINENFLKNNKKNYFLFNFDVKSCTIESTKRFIKLTLQSHLIWENKKYVKIQNFPK